MKVELYTDGAAINNPEGPGGYAYILRIIYDDGNVGEREYSEGYPKTTNNRMELMAVIRGLNDLAKSYDVTVYTDSEYVANGINKGWLSQWMKNNWKRGKKLNDDVKNVDLWQRLIVVMRRHNVTVKWVKGHDGNVFNERCDKLAYAAAKQFQHLGGYIGLRG